MNTTSFDLGSEKNAHYWGFWMKARRNWLEQVVLVEECNIEDNELNREWKAKKVIYCLQRAAYCLRKIRFFAKRF